jgi:hypothetical protein
VISGGSAAARSGRSEGALQPCKDAAYHLHPGTWAGPLLWWYRASSTPEGISADAAEEAFRRAATGIVSGRNDCHLPDRIGASERYLGRTTAKNGVRDDSTCGRPDGKSVVGFGILSPLDMAITCWWTRGDTTVEADIKLNAADYHWVTKVTSSCAFAWSVEDVATHEFGHAFGLEHVGEAEHGNLTMSPRMLPCQNFDTTLGLGDVLGLRARYPVRRAL